MTVLSAAFCASASEVLTSPDGKLAVTFDLTADGTPVYSMTFDGKEVVKPSRMGFELKKGKSLLDGFRLVRTTRGFF